MALTWYVWGTQKHPRFLDRMRFEAVWKCMSLWGADEMHPWHLGFTLCYVGEAVAVW